MNEFLVMKSVIVLLLVAVCHGEVEFQAHRRAGTNLGLIPFPRVGRTDPSLMNAYADVHEVKRQGLMAFPRIGRNELRSQFANQANLPAWILPENLLEYQKRNGGSNMNAGMWFGPRLGRLQKRSFDYNDTPWALVALKDPSGSLRQTDFAPRLSRESDEENDDSVVEEVLASRRLDTKNRNNISQQ